MLDLSGPRPADQMVRRVVRITLGGVAYELPVRSIRANREWKERLNAATGELLDNLESSSDRAAVVAAFDGHESDLIDCLLSYDTAGVLSRDVIEDIEPDATIDILRALREVWRAANPLLGIGAATAGIGMSLSSEPTSTPPPPTATARRKSSRNH